MPLKVPGTVTHNGDGFSPLDGDSASVVEEAYRLLGSTVEGTDTAFQSSIQEPSHVSGTSQAEASGDGQENKYDFLLISQDQCGTTKRSIGVVSNIAFANFLKMVNERFTPSGQFARMCSNGCKVAILRPIEIIHAMKRPPPTTCEYCPNTAPSQVCGQESE